MLYYSCPDSGDCLLPDLLLMLTRERESETWVGCCKDTFIMSHSKSAKTSMSYDNANITCPVKRTVL